MGQLACDDGNLINGDGCDSNCNIEPGFNCSGGNATQKDTCRNILNFSMSIDVINSFDQILLSFNKQLSQLVTPAGNLPPIDPSILSGINITVWGSQDPMREASIIDAFAESTYSIRLTLGNVGNTCGDKTILVNTSGVNFTDVWNNTLNATNVTASFELRCYASILHTITFNSIHGFPIKYHCLYNRFTSWNCYYCCYYQ